MRGKSAGAATQPSFRDPVVANRMPHQRRRKLGGHSFDSGDDEAVNGSEDSVPVFIMSREGTRSRDPRLL